ncbi:hypothetical protein JG688_00015823 [Phytophthora aleatoria]|uniref:Ankyrin repeat protein n=1 Tax=Phytophthora aleatoria TaxID=2496075 RepID=A0A8J5MD69_9STRA|nr:hypothetical protein JG688_00015823 [Phytophthora aleatoria]
MYEPHSDEMKDEGRDVFKKAILAASKSGNVDVVRFLLPKLDSVDEFRDASWAVMETAAERGYLDILSFAADTADSGYIEELRDETSGALLHAIYVTKFLYKTEKIPAQSITAALKNVTGIETMIQIHKKDREAIALFLCKEGCIPSEVICTVFAMTAYDLAGMVESLPADDAKRFVVASKAKPCALFAEQSLATGMLMITPLRASVAQSASRSPQNSKDNKVTVARERYALRQQQLPAWQSTMAPVVRESLVCVRGAEDARVRWWLEPQVLRVRLAS